jgi:LytS/YehU family sensor histidine kinase
MHYNVSDDAKERGIVMVTLQMLIDNAIKHNAVQAGIPLKIAIWNDGDYLHVYNNKQLREQIETSNGEGLKQLKQLYSYLSDKGIIIDDVSEYFSIKIPLL